MRADTIGLGIFFSFYSIWPFYYSLIAIAILRKRLSNKLHFFVFSVLSCYGLESSLRVLGRKVLNESFIGLLMPIQFFTWFLAILMVYWLTQLYVKADKSDLPST